MVGKAREPDNPLAFIRRCAAERRVYWTYHVNMRLPGRFISREQILGAAATYEIIESYPHDKYLPSYLVNAETDGHAIHVLFATDIADDNIRVVTSYRPDPAEWSKDLKSRRK